MKKVYIVGIGGAGTSALAVVYAKKGYDVSGVDTGDGFYHEMLVQNGIVVYDTFDVAHLTDHIDFVVYTTALNGTDNVEIIAAKEKGITIYSYPEAVGALTAEMSTIAVCGTHGKTTTTALTAFAMIATDVKPTVIVGSQISAWNGGAYVTGDDILIIEADEYQNKLALYQPHDVILTSVDYDHPDFFADVESYRDVFGVFVARIPQDGILVACGDQGDVCAVAAHADCRVVFYGEDVKNDCVIMRRSIDAHGQKITVLFEEKEYEIMTQLYGAHNAANATAAWLLAFLLTGDAYRTAEGVAQFAGTARRFERRGEYNGAILVDDYAHHPKEIVETLRGTREVFPGKKIIVAFHPHTFTRTEALLSDFAAALAFADQVVVLDIYGSAREKKGNINAMRVVEAINDLSPSKAQHLPTIVELGAWMKKYLSDGDVFITMGAGDIWKVYNEL
ncbi:MAG: UDP-N-acetylmuramate--L-alanine ligase [Parcubacteria group bacterium]